MPKYIDADKLIEHIQDKVDVVAVLDSKGKHFAAVKDAAVISAIAGFPSANVREDTHGQWIEGAHGFCHCSECGYEPDFSWEKEHFCPSCGANMEPDGTTGEHRPRAGWVNSFGHPRCSRCGEAAGINPYDSLSRWESRFCPSCGAVMENCDGDGKIDAWNWK